MAGTTLAMEVHSVTVHRQGAVVTRVAELDGAWPEQVEVGDLPLSLLDETVRVEAVARDADLALPQPTDVRVDLALPPVEPPPPPPSQEELEQVRREIRRQEGALTRLREEMTHLDRLALRLAPEPEEGGRPPAAPLGAWLQLIDWLDQARTRRLASRREIERELQGQREHLARLERAEQLSRAQRGPDPQEVRKRVVVCLRGGAGQGPLVLKLEYQVPGARWRPTYVLRVARDGRTAELGVRAMVAQRSGEPWERVRLALSTADLRRETAIPELTSLRIGRRQTPPRKGGYREPPGDTEALFRALDDALAVLGGSPPPPPPPLPGRDPFGGGAPLPIEAFEPSSDEGGSDPFASGAAELEDGMRLDAAMDMRVDDGPSFDPFGAAPPPGAAKAMPPSPPRAAPSVMASMAPVMERARRSMAPQAKKRGRGMADFGAGGGPGGGAMAFAAPEPEPELEGELRPGSLDYGCLVLRGWDDARGVRGQLRPLRLQDQLRQLPAEQQLVVEQTLRVARQFASSLDAFPGGTSEVSEAAGSYDYRYEAGGLLDVPSDGKLHNVPLFARQAPVVLTLIAVPREGTDVVRVAALKNPLQAPLLAGPADVYLEEEFLVTAPIRTVPGGAELQVGLGLEQGLKVARNTHFEEVVKAGLLGGSTSLQHRVELEIASRLSVPVQVEVRERVPVVDDEQGKEVKVVLGQVTPPWEDFDQRERAPIKGGKRWRFELAPGAERKLSYRYEVQLGSKQELSGGNRRD